MEIGISTFVETTPDPQTGEVISHAQRIREVVEEIVLADQVGLDVYGVGEHHRKDYAASAPAVILAAAAAQTQRIRLTSAVTVLSSDDPVRVFQDFATLDGISNGRAEIMAGRGSFIESFPLFGYDLDNYDELFDEKLELLLKIRESEKVTWKGGHRPAINNLGVYPRPVQNPLPVWIGSGGNQESVVRAGLLGLPLVLAIIGGSPMQFAPLVELYKKAAKHAGHDASLLPVASHSHGFIAETTELAAEKFFPSTQQSMNVLGRERGWGPYTRSSFDAARSFEGALYVGDPDTVAKKIIHLRKQVGITRFLLHVPVGTMPHDDVMRAIELLGTEVAPRVREEISKWESESK
ncbi:MULTISPECIES: LLM class flavin-dependent oxidoreductase [Paenibacillus]|uniref:LLM class flavin-dependent oxidoreductase n=1 Tax=Paenibacillus TaxID=44249 RepID=UPI000737D482|nr:MULTISPECIES: LLM class flavin-dependent oxidoreductase [Paenibacillus]MBU9706062.1 LLM class flavin-dependent oxidoreductase [Paenibacillus sp. AK121]MCV9950208.1 LLM class flavin-dependent oxidoreductase [Paenibacillus sp. BT-177]KAF6563363.1 LLM class flavin-dependent oxidoreductase [Paenibacillus sp. EKM202P]KAF6570041.1 LLM class flavin-dependent oxidoreductase [Paenibacillus sp. EKM207P]MEE4568074.1 LLM class flavin-dependent oxidoreductase [Paenibacillus polymyxa]